MRETAAPTGATAAPRRTNWRIAGLATLAGLALIAFATLLYLQVHTDRERDDALRWQAHSYEVIARAAALRSATAEAEAALGRYVVSADKRNGGTYADAWRRAADTIERLQSLTRDNPEQQRVIAALRTDFAERGKELADTAGYSAHNRNLDAWGRYYQISESEAWRRLEGRIDALIANERTLLSKRSTTAAALLADSTFATRALGAFGVLVVIGAILLGWTTLEAERARDAADEEAGAERVRSAELEEAVAAATERLRAEARERAEAEAQLRQVQKMEAVGQLTGGIAHDFNNMLAVVLGGLELAKRHIANGGPDAQRHIENAREGANRAAALTRRLLAFARAEPLLPEAVEAGALIAGMSDLLDRTLGDTIEVVTQDAGAGWRVWVDRHQLENALLNLAVNARDAMDGRGTLTIATGSRTLAESEIGRCRPGDYVTIAVSDTGCGMTPQVLERVFEPFFTTKPVGKGTGLGLSQIFGFVRQSGGEIGIETAPGEGATVTLFLPRHRGATGVAAASPSGAGDVPAAARALDILVVEDDPRVLGATLDALGELGHRAVGCDDPLAVPARLAAMEALDCIVSDVLMPGQTGPEMIAALGDRIAGTAVLFVTGYAGETDAGRFGGHEVLRKPYTLAALGRGIERAMDAAAARQAAE